MVRLSGFQLSGMLLPEEAGERIAVVDKPMWFKEMALVLHKEFAPQGLFSQLRWFSPWFFVRSAKRTLVKDLQKLNFPTCKQLSGSFVFEPGHAVGFQGTAFR